MSLGQNHIGAAQLRPYLEKCGYHDGLLASNIQLTGGRTASLAGFSSLNHDSRSACIAVTEITTTPEADVIACRNIGAPIVFARSNGYWQFWKQGETKPELWRPPIPVQQLPQFFEKELENLRPQRIYQAKTLARFDSSYQLSFVDIGLMPVIEEAVGKDLAKLIERVIVAVKHELGGQPAFQQQDQWLIQSTFWLLAAKILQDKSVPAFVGLNLENTDAVFSCVGKHYGSVPLHFGSHLQKLALRGAAQQIAQFSSLTLVSIETLTNALAYLYENAFIDNDIRKALGTHSTPTYLVDYIVGRLRLWIKEMPAAEHQVFEPACGHAAFLLAAMRLINELPEGNTLTDNARYKNLRARIHGVEFDGFAREIARLSLTLADVPNHNGWDLQKANMFQGDLLTSQTQRASIILANPPFDDFTASERALFSKEAKRPVFVNKAAEMLWRIITNMQPGAVFGVVLPQALLDSKNSTQLRECLIGNFEIGEICLFPDKVFNFSDAESVVLLGRRLKPGQQQPPTVAYKWVKENEIDAFQKTYQPALQYDTEYARFAASANWSLRIPQLPEMWDFCSNYPRFEEVAEIGQGFSFRSKNSEPPLPEGAITKSMDWQTGLVCGFARLREHLQTHHLPDEVWFNLDDAVIRRPLHGKTLGKPQIVLNYARVSREAWRLKAFIDQDGHPVTGRFNVIRPKGNDWPLEALWGLCNSPVANCYAYSHSTKRDVQVGTMRKMPIPDMNTKNVAPLVSAVHNYFDALANHPELFAPSLDSKLKELHWRIDAEVLKLYDLPRELERKLLDMFSGIKRRGVPFEQTEYFPKEFTDPITLSELLAITYDWEETNERRADLIVKKVERIISPEEKAELDNLQRLATARRHLLAPLPLKELEELREDMIRRGVWAGN